MTRILSLFVLAALSTPAFADGSEATGTPCDRITDEWEKYQCQMALGLVETVSSQQEWLAKIEAERTADKAALASLREDVEELQAARESEPPASPAPQPAGELVPVPYIPAYVEMSTGMEYVATTSPPAVAMNGVSVRYLNEVAGPTAMVCAKNSRVGYVQMTGPLTLEIYADMDGDGHADPTPYRCARATAEKVWVMGIGARPETATLVWVIPTGKSVGVPDGRVIPTYRFHSKQSYYGSSTGGMRDTTAKAGF